MQSIEPFTRECFSAIVKHYSSILERHGVDLYVPRDPIGEWEDFFQKELFSGAFGWVEGRKPRNMSKRLSWDLSKMDKVTLELAAVLQAFGFRDAHDKSSLTTLRATLCRFLAQLGYAETEPYIHARARWGCYREYTQLARRSGASFEEINRYRAHCRALFPEAYED